MNSNQKSILSKKPQSLLKRRNFLKTLGGVSLFPFLSSEMSPLKYTKSSNPKLIPRENFTDSYGYLSILQGPTSKNETLINVFAPRLKKYDYLVFDKNQVPQNVELYESLRGPTFYKIDKLVIRNLNPKGSYTLKIMDGKTCIDERFFKTLDLDKWDPHFALISCMSDDHRFNSVIDPMWERLRDQEPDFLILSGDQVYVDSFEFVERQKANDYDLWQRYVDSLRRIPLYHWKQLVPVFALWDDHDYGTNDGDRNFISRDSAIKLFQGTYGGLELPGVWEKGPGGICSSLKAFGQVFYFMDDRSFRQPNKNQLFPEPYGHWGQMQHEWLIQKLSLDSSPSWIINGNQVFNGVTLSYKEAFELNHPKEFIKLIDSLQKLPQPVVFGSGDIHLSEIMRVPKERIGYETFEFTSSSMHSYKGDGWENPMRLQGAYCKEHNFMMIRSVNKENTLQIDVTCLSLAENPEFEVTLTVGRV